MAIAERIVVQASPQDKETFVAKAKRLDITLSELMRRGASNYEPDDADDELGALADAARSAADNAGAAIDDALAFIAASNARIEVMEAARTRTTTRDAA